MTIAGIHDAVNAQAADLIAIRRDLHQHPELAFEEHRTANLIAEELRRLGLDVRTGLGRTGVVGVLHGGAATATSRTVMVRADIDALPILEDNDQPYRSQAAGKMHACGHDGHIAIGLGVARALVALRADLPGTVVFAFQPAEERASGAEEMLRDGAMRDPQPDAVIGLHLWSPFEVGTVGIKPGPIFASADEFTLTVRGKGGHGAVPQTSVDPIVVAAQVVTALQTLISREISPFHPAVVTVGSIHGGTAFNVIADTVEMLGTVRTYDPADREHILRRIGELAQNVAQSMRATCEFATAIGIPPCVSDPGIASIVYEAAADIIGEDHIIADCMQTVGDDMAYFLNTVPGCYFLVGAGNRAKGITAPHHSARFDIDEGCLTLGAEILASAAWQILLTSA